jgi:hypothetical protein
MGELRDLVREQALTGVAPVAIRRGAENEIRQPFADGESFRPCGGAGRSLYAGTNADKFPGIVQSHFSLDNPCDGAFCISPEEGCLATHILSS